MSERLDGKKTVVVGLGASGEAAARLLRARGASVVATDSRPRAQLAQVAESLEATGISLVLGGHHGVDLLTADLVVVSPGVPNLPWLREASRRGVRIVSELELASWYTHAPLVAIGGTNGKSTTTELAAAFARATGRPVFAGGNLGTPLAQAVVEADPGVVSPEGIAVVEVSSFQLERVAGFRPRASVLLNVTDDHLDRYPSFEAYAQAKGNAFRAQAEGDVAIVPYGDPLCLRLSILGGGRVETIDGPLTGEGAASVGLVDRGGVPWIWDERSGHGLPLSELPLSGRHNVTNVCAAWAAVRSLGVDASPFADVVRAFRGLPHRTVLVGTVGGVRYYDDSKGTNVGAAVTALLGLSEARAVLIAGGRDKGGSYGPLVEALRVKGRGLVVIGEAGPTIAACAAEALGPDFAIERASSMEDAVVRSARLAHDGDAVLLSPACSSFDMFRDYKHRGDVFVAAVRHQQGVGTKVSSGGSPHE